MYDKNIILYIQINKEYIFVAHKLRTTFILQ